MKNKRQSEWSFKKTNFMGKRKCFGLIKENMDPANILFAVCLSKISYFMPKNQLKTSQYEWLLMSVFSRPSYIMLSWPTRENSWEGNFSQDWQNYSAWMNYFRDSFHKILQLCKFKNVKNELEKPNYNFMFGWIWLI